jgi:uncharacterized protein (TIGR02147 family)
MQLELSEYSDYRVLLKDLYQARKGKNRKFSYRYIALHAGFKSAAFFSHILHGKSNISLRTALSLAQVFKLKGPDLEYFENLVHFNQADTKADKEHFHRRLVSLRRGRPKTLTVSQYELFSKWYYLPVRELISLTRFAGDFKELAALLVPAITVAEAKEAVKVLEGLGLVRKHDGLYERLDTALTTGAKWSSATINKYQLMALDLAKSSYRSVPITERSHSTLTVTLSEPEFQSIREEISVLRRKILEVAKNAPTPDRVYQITFNFFPLSKVCHAKA